MAPHASLKNEFMEDEKYYNVKYELEVPWGLHLEHSVYKVKKYTDWCDNNMLFLKVYIMSLNLIYLFAL